ncbi:MAG TPA: GntR family transcriptional regulator [Pararhizobium sp.]|uniref:GntR family transcriptional regulator n=1 Tax=Pararhizobium sp. TaxID=1977563 RepID=UPI002C8C3297|nr:GntR family transcriptional regulator [Pararhizobium sp.]HTO34338.1 GntR family transcriptional regulator [Pararhizobium sp.]
MPSPKTYMTKAEHARQHIQSMVLSGSVGPGDRITTREVSDALGISETPIREAIRSLASEGWLEVQNHIGAVVQGLRAPQIREISALRGLICGLAVELGAANFDTKRLAKIDENIEVSAEALDRDDFAAFGDRNLEFHLLLCDNPESPWCKRLLENMHGLMSAQRHGIAPQPQRLRDALKEHMAIRDKLHAGDFSAAAALVNQHEKNTGDFLIRMIGEVPEGGAARAT